LLRPDDTNFSIWVGYIKWQLGIATLVSVMNVKVTVAKNRKSVSAHYLVVSLADWSLTWFMGSLY